ncbi:hypothetical protein D9M73_221000 [compost metagenome]
MRLSGTEPVLKKISKPRPTPTYCGREVRNEPSTITGASITHSNGNPSIQGKMKNISTKPISAPSNVPHAI